jgi:hypothetical protein
MHSAGVAIASMPLSENILPCRHPEPLPLCSLPSAYRSSPLTKSSQSSAGSSPLLTTVPDRIAVRSGALSYTTQTMSPQPSAISPPPLTMNPQPIAKRSRNISCTPLTVSSQLLAVPPSHPLDISSSMQITRSLRNYGPSGSYQQLPSSSQPSASRSQPLSVRTDIYSSTPADYHADDTSGSFDDTAELHSMSDSSASGPLGNYFLES